MPQANHCMALAAFFVVFVSICVFRLCLCFKSAFVFLFVFAFSLITFAAAKNKTLCIVHTLAANSMPLT